MVLEIINGSKEDLHMKDEFLRHPDRIKILAITDLPQHIRYARSTGFLKG